MDPLLAGDAGGGPGSGEAAVRAKRIKFVRESVVILGGAIIALMSATPNAFDVIARQFQADTDTSAFYTSAFLGVGVAGLQLTVFGGMLIDKKGPVVGVIVGGVCVVAGYWAMSFTQSPGLLIFEYAVVSLGSGCTFLSALSTAIGMGYAIGVGIVSLTMSLSISFTVLLTKTYAGEHCDMSDNNCWREYIRVWSVFAAGAFIIGAVALLARIPPQEASATGGDVGRADFADRAASRAASAAAGVPRPTSEEHVGVSVSTVGARVSGSAVSHRSTASSMASLNYTSLHAAPTAVNLEFNIPMSFRESLVIFKKPFFLCLFFGNTVAIGAGVMVITSAQSLYDEYNNDQTKLEWNQLITVYFSIMSASANVVAPLLSDFLHSRGWLRRSRFVGVLLGLVAADFAVLGVMAVLPHNHVGACALKYAYVMILAANGVGFGSFLTIFPTTLSDTFGFVNFGTFMSFMQLGSATFAILLPTIVTGIHALAGSFVPLYFGMATLLFLASIAMTLPRPFSASFPTDAKPLHTS